MSDLDALLRGILAEPWSDENRKVYADCVEEVGGREGADRAKFIRAQIDLARMASTVCEKCEQPTGFYRYTPRCRGEVCKLRMREYYAGRRYTVWDWCRGLPAGSRPVYRRGFVEGVSVTLAEFVGGECTAPNPSYPDERCDGGRVRSPNPQFTRDCWVCRGTGRTPGLDLKAVFGSHPVTAVRISDREPHPSSFGGGYIWFDDDGGQAAEREAVPGAIFDLLAGFPIPLSRPARSHKRFDTRDAALSALSDAAVQLGRTAAKLPPL